MEETHKLVQLCHEFDYESLPAEVVDRVKYLLLDYLGVAARGALSESSQPAHKMIRRQGDFPNGTPVIGTKLKTTPPFAALGNGIAAHSLELDDVVNAASLHPGVCIMSAALPAGSQAGVNGKDFIAAVVAGYEVTVKLGIALDPAAHYSRGFHPTGTCGTLGAAITAAKLLNLDRPAMANAIGIAGS
jgi:2-methylcitrate dehydratase PrpD